MLPYLAASGHNHYTKSAWVYLQRMSQLEEQHPDIYQQFQEGLHVVRRSDRLWAGLSTDLLIEQVLMRSMKTSGGLTSHILHCVCALCLVTLCVRPMSSYTSVRPCLVTLCHPWM